MGSFNVRIAKSSADKQQFMHHLLSDIKALELMFDKQMIESETYRIGVEQELCFVDKLVNKTDATTTDFDITNGSSLNIARSHQDWNNTSANHFDKLLRHLLQ